MTQDRTAGKGSIQTRRSFLTAGAAATVGGIVALHSRPALASPLGLPIGLQLYSVREMLAKDYAGTLKQIAALGYQEVEAAGFFNHSPQEVKAAMQGAGLRLVSAHYASMQLQPKFDETVSFCRDLGVRYIICSFPGFRDPARVKGQDYKQMVKSFTMDDYHWNADTFNAWGRKVKSAGMQFGYHNHTMEFAQQNGVVPFDEMIRLTDPALVTFEMDCGWVHVGGGDPIAYLRKYPTRISMLHVKDFKHTDRPASVVDPPPAAELGRGTQDFRPIFEAAKQGSIKHYFVEQEEFDLPPLESLRIDADYMKALKV